MERKSVDCHLYGNRAREKLVEALPVKRSIEHSAGYVAGAYHACRM